MLFADVLCCSTNNNNKEEIDPIGSNGNHQDPYDNPFLVVVVVVRASSLEKCWRCYLARGSS